MMHSALTVVVIALVTAALRFLPFIVFGRGRKTPEYVLYLGRVLPYAIMGMLIVYCLKDATFGAFPFAAPELMGIAATALLFIWKRNTLLSIGLGTVIYMLLVQYIFK